MGVMIMNDQVNQKLPAHQTVALGLQHVLAMYAGAIAIPIIIAGAVGLTPTQLSLLIAIDLFTCGIATLIMAGGLWNFAGLRLPIVMGVTFTTIGPMISIALNSEAGMLAVWGSIIVAGFFVVLIAPVFSKLLKFFPPLVTGSIVTIIGISLIPVGINNAAGGYNETWGDVNNLFLAALVIITIVFANRFFKGFARTLSILIGLVVGTIVAGFMGMVNTTEVFNAQWVSIIRPFSFGIPVFEISAIITMCLTLVVVMAEGIGTFVGTGEICEKPITENDLKKAYRAEGISTMIGGIFNAFPYTTYYQNLGLLAITKIKSRYVVISAGIILMVLGSLPKVAALATIIPVPVFGGAMIVMFAMVAAAGIKMLQIVDFNETGNLIVASVAMGVGCGIGIVPGILDKMPVFIQTLFGGGIVAGSILAVLLNLIFNYKEIKVRISTNETEIYDKTT